MDLSTAPSSEQEIVLTLFDLGRQVTSVLDFDQLLEQIPRLLSRLVAFEAFAVYLLEERKAELRVAYSIGYPPGHAHARLRIGEGLVGAAVASGEPLLVNDVSADERYLAFVPDMGSEIVVPLVHKSRAIGALNILGRRKDQYTLRDLAIVRQFSAHVAVALANARLYEQSRLDAEAFETLAEIGREVAALLDINELFTRIGQLARRLIDYRALRILLLNEDGELEIQQPFVEDSSAPPPVLRLGEGLVGYAALHKEPVLVPDVRLDPRYIEYVPDVRSEAAIPLLVKDRCIGVLNLESPEPDAFSKRDIEIMSLLAAQVAVAIENARLYEAVRANEERLEKEAQFARRVQTALLPAGPPRRLKGVEIAGAFEPAREVGGDFHDYLAPEANTLVVAVGDVSGKGMPAALYGAFAAELVRGRTYRRRFLPERSSPASVLASINTILHERQLEEYYCTVLYSIFDLKRRTMTMASSGLPYAIRCTADACAQIELPGVPLGAFPGTTYDEVTFALHPGDVFLFCTDGVFEAMNEIGQEFTAARAIEVVERLRGQSARAIVDAIVKAVEEWRGDAPPNDDMTAVAVRITA